MSTYSNRLQPALQNLLQRVRFFHPRSSCPTHYTADVCGGRKSLVKPVTWQNISSCSVLSPEIVMHDAYIGGRLRRTKITRKASDAAEYIDLFDFSFTRDRHA